MQVESSGWCAIGPPPGSFSLIPAAVVTKVDAEQGIIRSEQPVPAWVGTRLGSVGSPVSQVSLQNNDRVKILGEISWPIGNGQSTSWFQIVPPPGEVRWIQQSDLGTAAEIQPLAAPGMAAGRISSASFNSVTPPVIAQFGDIEFASENDLSANAAGVTESGGLVGGEQGLELAVGEGDSKAMVAAADWLEELKIGYDGGFLIASEKPADLQAGNFPFRLRFNGWGQLRQTITDFEGPNPDLNQFQLKRARLIFSGSAFTSDFSYYFQLDGRSTSGDNVRLLDYYLDYDLGHHAWNLERGQFRFRTGRWKMPFSLARYLSGREFEFTDRSVASMFFDVNRSLAWGLNGRAVHWRRPAEWELAVFNGLVTGGAETGSSGTLDNNFAYSGRVFVYPAGDWGRGELADFEIHQQLATRVGAGFANSTISRDGETEFSRIRVNDSGAQLSSLLPMSVDEYTVNLFAIDASAKYRGWSFTYEYYFRTTNDFQGADLPDLFDHGFWLQIGKFVIPEKLELLSRWSRVDGNSGTLGMANQSAEEIAGGLVWYFREQNAKFTLDATFLDGAPISADSLDIRPGDSGLLYRTQIQFAF